MSRRKQDPWENAPLLEVQDAPPARQALTPNQTDLSVREVVRRPDGTSYAVVGRSATNETPEQLTAQGYQQDEQGIWYKTVGEANLDRTAAPDPWDSAPVLTDSQLRAEQVSAQRIQGGDALRSGGGAYNQGASLGFADEAAGQVAGLGQLAGNAFRRVTGQPIEINSADLRNAMTQGVRGEADRFARERPVSNFALQTLGGLTTGGLAGGGRATIGNAVRQGAIYGAGYGAGTAEGGFADRLQGAAVGGVVGGVAGGAVQGGLNAASPYATRLLGIVGNSTRPARESVGRALGRGAGDPEASAAQRLLRDIDVPSAVAERQRLTELGLSPSVMDVAGGTTERTIRMAAGPAGPAAERAVENSVARSANLKPEIMSVTRGLSDDPRSAVAVRTGLEETRDSLAREQYAEPYAQMIEITPEIIAPLQGDAGRQVLRRAMRAADAAQDSNQVSEINALSRAVSEGLDATGPRPAVSGATLDRIQIALRDQAERLSRKGSRDIARGFRARQNEIGTLLDNFEGLAEARSTYRNLSGAIDAIDKRPDVFTTDPRDFASWVRELSPEQRQAAVVGVRQDILDTLGGQRSSGTGSLEQLAQAQYSRANLSALLSEEEAGRYLSSIGARVQQTQRAARVSPNTNSQTFGRAMDEGNETANRVSALVDATGAFRGDVGGLARTIDRIRARATMTPQERENIVQIGLGPADDLERIVRLAEAARRNNRPPPREVRGYLDGIRNTLGAQSPVTQQIELLLLPAPVSAEERQ